MARRLKKENKEYVVEVKKNSEKGSRNVKIRRKD